MQRPNASTYMMKRGFFFGFLAALIYSIIPMGAPAWNPSAFLSLVCPPVWLIALVLGAIPGAIIGFVLGLFYEAHLATMSFPQKPISLNFAAFAVTVTALFVAIVDAALLLVLFGNQPITPFGSYTFNYAPYLTAVPFIAACVSAMISYGYFENLMAWYERYPYDKRKQLVEKRKNGETT